MGWIMMILAGIIEGVDGFANKRVYSLYNVMVLYSLFFIACQLIKIEHNNKS